MRSLSVFIAGIIFFSFGSRKNQENEKECRALYEKVISFNNEYRNGPVYMKFLSQSFMDSDDGQIVTNEAWVNRESALFKNNLITIFSKKTQQAYIMHSTKKIILKKVTDKPEGTATPINYSYDSLKKYAVSISCSKINDNSVLYIALPPAIGKTKNNLNKIIYYFDNAAGSQLKKVEMEYFGESRRIDKYEYLKISRSVDNLVLEQSLDDFIFSNEKKLKSEFKGYEVQDQRTNEFLNNKK
jgi:hypothetical protein